MVRYEDLGMDPFGTVDEMFKFLGLLPHRLIYKFIEKHTHISRSNLLATKGIKLETPNEQEKAMKERRAEPHGTTRNSKATVFLWKNLMKTDDILEVQRHCKTPMIILGYNPMTNITNNRMDDNFPLIIKSSEQLVN